MNMAKGQIEGPSRRRSMLPQKTIIRASSKPMNSLPKKQESDIHESVGQCATLAENQASAVSQAAHQKSATMLPPSKLQLNARARPPTQKSDSAKTSHTLREPLTSRKSSQDRSANARNTSQDFGKLSQPRPRVRIGSGGSDSQSNVPESYHGRRSWSQQVRPAPTSDPLLSKAFPQRQLSMKDPRPAASAMQQYFSSKKSIQANPSTLSPSRPIGKDATPSADLSHSQMELAQLHLLHRSMLPVQAQWEKSARDLFEHRFNALYERHTELKDVALQQQTLIDQLSLVQWCQNRSGAQIAEKVQFLSRSILDICNLLSSEGKHTRILEVFESWFTQALTIRDQRESISQKSGRELDFIEGIGDGWKAETMVLERELTYSARDIECFGGVSSTSSLCRILSLYGKLVVGLLEELDLIQWCESEIMSQETLWIENTMQKRASNVNEDIDLIGPDQKTS